MQRETTESNFIREIPLTSDSSSFFADIPSTYPFSSSVNHPLQAPFLRSFPFITRHMHTKYKTTSAADKIWRCIYTLLKDRWRRVVWKGRKGRRDGRKEGSRFSVLICTIGGSSFGRIHGFRAIQSWNDEFTRLQLLTLEKEGRKWISAKLRYFVGEDNINQRTFDSRISFRFDHAISECKF